MLDLGAVRTEARRAASREALSFVFEALKRSITTPCAHVVVGLEPIDLWCSFDRLGGLVTERVGLDVRGGAVFVFF